MGRAKRLLLVGWSGADWAMAHPLLDAGQLPVLKRIVNSGSIGRIATMQPAVAPLVWSSIATGTRPARHGVSAYLRPEQGGLVPQCGADRRAEPFWQACSKAGLTTHVVNWPTYPAEPISGTFVSSCFARWGDDEGTPPHRLRRAVHSANVEELASLRIDPREITAADLLPFVPRADRVDQSNDPGLAILASRLADTASAHAMATRLMEDDWDVMAVVYDLIDRLGASFMRFHPPRHQVTHHSFELYRNVMTQAYRFCDQMLGRLLSLAGDDTHVVLFSDHGLRSGDDRPRGEATGRGDAAWVTPLGMLAIAGEGVHADRWVWGGSLLDIAPTVCHLVGVSTRAPDGHVLRDAFVEPPPIPNNGEHSPRGDDGIDLEPLDEEEIPVLTQLLRDDGYVHQANLTGPDADAVAQDACDFNLGQSHLQFGEVAAARDRFLACHQRRPAIPRFAIAVARCHAVLGDMPAANRMIEQAVEQEVPGWLGDRLRGQLLASEARFEEALERLLSSESVRPKQAGINAEIGGIYARLARPDDARRGFRRELRINANDAASLRGLGKLALDEEQHDEALDYLLAAAALQEVAPETHYLLAKVLHAMRRFVEADRAIQKALRQSPSYPGATKLRDAIAAALAS